MPANEEGPSPGTSGDKVKVKFIHRGEEQALLPMLQSNTYSAKSLLTKSIKALDAAVVAFNNLDKETMLTKKRQAGILLEKVESVIC